MIEFWLHYKCYRNSEEGKILRLKQGNFLEVEKSGLIDILKLSERTPTGKNVSHVPSLLPIVKVIKARN